jgi:hypothetical protein
MVENPTTSDADETPGKYSTDDPITFSNLLNKQTDADRDPLKFQKDRSPKHPEIAEANEQRQREDSASQSPSSQANKEKEFDQRQKQLAEQILRQDLRGRGPSIEYGSTTTSHSNPRWYSLRQTSYNGCEYYYLICERYASTFEAEAVIIDFGTEVTFTPLTPTRQFLDDAIEQQRRDDFRDGRKPVSAFGQSSWMHSKQVIVILSSFDCSKLGNVLKGDIESQFQLMCTMSLWRQTIVFSEFGTKFLSRRYFLD